MLIARKYNEKASEYHVDSLDCELDEFQYKTKGSFGRGLHVNKRFLRFLHTNFGKGKETGMECDGM